MNKRNPEVVCEAISLLGEGPVWDPRTGSIVWIDILAGKIHRYEPDAGTYTSMEVGQMIGALAPRRRGGYIAALKDGFAFIDLDRQTVEFIIDPEADIPGNRFNDGKCDRAGNFWAGSMSVSEAEDEPGTLYVIDKELQVRSSVTGIRLSNGLAWTDDDKTFYHIDSPVREIRSYPFDLSSGITGAGKVVIKFKEEDGYPDGMTIDTENKLWIAHYDGWQVSRWDPESGRKLLQIDLPVSQITCCTFGGPDYRDLYITTARQRMSPDQIKEQPLAGSLFVIRNCGFQGYPPAYFEG